MHRPKRLRPLVLGVLLCGCGGGSTDSGIPSPEERAELDLAITRVIEYTWGVPDITHFQAVLQYAERRFDVHELAGARARYDLAMSRAGERVFRRIVDRTNVAVPADIATLSDTDVMVAAALYCDVSPPSSDYPTSLEAGRRARGYWLTHVLLSLELMRENGCTNVVSTAFEDSVATEVSRLVADSGPPTDLEIESQAFLSLVGRADLMQDGFIERLLPVQDAGGGFAAAGSDAGDRWHASGLALWVLLAVRHPDAPWVPFIDPR